MFKISQTCFAARPHVQINSSRYSESSEFLPTIFAVTLPTVALLIVLKVKFEVILYTVHYYFCFLNSWKLDQNSLESAPIIMFRGKNTSPEKFKFFFLSSHHTTGTYSQNIAQQHSQCLLMTRHVYLYFPCEQIRLLKRANHA